MDKKKIFNLIIILIVILGAILRLKTYLLARPLWHDECSLAMNIIDRSLFDFFRPLEFVQSAPPIFMILTKLISLGFGVTELPLRVLPFVAGILSVPAFYFLSKIYLDKPWSIIAANLLFAINYQLIYYSQEFKQYSSDVLFVILCLILVSSVKLEKRPVLYGSLMVILPLISLPTAFVIIPYLIIKRNLHAAIPFFTGMGLYYFFSLVPARKAMLSVFDAYWSAGFLRFGNILELLKINMNFYFQPNTFVLLGTGLICAGIYYLIKEKKEPALLLMLVMAVLASFAHVYPLFGRLSLFLLPALLILLIKPLDYISAARKGLSAFLIILTVIFLAKYDFNYMKSFFSPEIFAKINGKEIMQILKENYEPDDYVIITDASRQDYLYNSAAQGFYTKKYGIINLSTNIFGHEKILDSLPRGKSYWFYCGYDYAKSPVIPLIKKWKNNKKVLAEIETTGAYLLKVQY